MKLYSNGNILQIYHNASQIQNLQKRNILLTDYNGGDTVVIILLYREGDIRNGNNTITLDYSDITVPATFTSGSDLNTWLVAALQDVLDEADNDGSNLIGKPSGGDFVTSYNGATSLDCDGMPTIHPVLIDEDLTEVWQINSAQEVINVFERDEVAMVVTNPAGTTYRITIATAAFGATDTFIVYTNVSTSGGTVHVEDTAHVSGDKGFMSLVVRKDVRGTMVDTDGDYASPQTNAVGEIRFIDDDLNTVTGTTSDATIVAGAVGSVSAKLRLLTTDLDANKTSVASLDLKEGTTGEAADVDGTRAAQLRYIGSVINTSLTTPTTIGVKTNTAVGTSSEQLTADSVTCKRIVVTAHPDNTGRMTVGPSGVTDGYGIVLYAADSIEMFIDNVNKIYVISSVDAEDISLTYFN